MSIQRFLAFLFLVVTSTPSMAGQWDSVYFRLSSDSYSEPNSLHSFINEFEGDFDGGKYAYTNNLFEIGAKYNNIGISFISRYDYFLEFSQDLAQFYRETENDIDQAPFSRYALTLDASHFKGNGIKLDYDWSFNEKLWFNIALSYLEAQDFLDGSIDGALALDDSDEYTGALNLAVNSTEDKLLELSVDNPKGSGYAVDLAASWIINSQWSAKIKIVDAYSKFSWKDALDSDFELATARKSTDSDGNLVLTPFLMGSQFITEVDQKLPSKTHLLIDYTFSDRHIFYGSLFHTKYFVQSTFGYRYQLGVEHNIGATWNIDTDALGISYQSRYLQFSIVADTLNTEKAHALGMSLGFSLAL